MSSLIASRINSIGIILEFQIPAPSRHNKIQARLIIRTNMISRKEILISRRMMDNVHNNTVIQKLELENSKLETGFPSLTSEAA